MGHAEAARNMAYLENPPRHNGTQQVAGVQTHAGVEGHRISNPYGNWMMLASPFALGQQQWWPEAHDGTFPRWEPHSSETILEQDSPCTVNGGDHTDGSCSGSDARVMTSANDASGDGWIEEQAALPASLGNRA